MNLILSILIEINGLFLQLFYSVTSLIFKFQSKLLISKGVFSKSEDIFFDLNGLRLKRVTKTKMNSRQVLNNYTSQSVDLEIYEDGHSLVKLVIPTDENNAFRVQSKMRSYFKNSKFLKEIYNEK